MEIINNPIISEGAKWIIILLAGVMLRNVRKILKRMKLIEYKLQATDFALEKSFKNGYADHRDQKLIELIQSDKFVNK